MNELHSSSLVGLIVMLLIAACNDTPPAKNGGSPTVDAPRPAADPPSVNASDVKGPDVGGPAARAPSVNANDIKAPQMNGPSVNAHVETGKPDAGVNHK